MRLIDADLLIERIYKNTKIGHYGEFMDGSEVAYTHNEIVKAIEEQPTAFDIEKVVDELEKESIISEGYLMNFTEEACDIVRLGGKTECER